jgi:hypothetical protein
VAENKRRTQKDTGHEADVLVSNSLPRLCLFAFAVHAAANCGPALCSLTVAMVA